MTLFEKIVARQIPAEIVYEDEHVCAFRDIAPKAPTHVLVIPKRPIPRVADATEADAELLGRVLLAAARVAEAEGIAEDGYRLVINNGEAAGQTVFHVHCHLLGGRALGWPPG
jgi:histidine triad (HIT) family protein